MSSADTASVRDYLTGLQARICRALEIEDGEARFMDDAWSRPESSAGLWGDGLTSVLEGGVIFERAGVALSDVRGKSLPAAATVRHPELAGLEFRALGVSLVVHPLNPYVPTTHLNVRYLSAGNTWWFGGGFDLTPFLPFESDAVHWHRVAQAACAPFGDEYYPALRKACDDYFFLKHRNEARGIGGLFFDDFNEALPKLGRAWDDCFALQRSVGDRFLEAYLPIVSRRRAEAHGERERRYQLYRRGRYVEFNLVHDRGTIFGLQSGGRIDAILMSMPPAVGWSYRSPDAEYDARLLPFLTTRRGFPWAAAGPQDPLR
ncbi:MAG TPA: oxygen-dependent coproporphyrinogen oxidase [Steroidobacteraceae bacterium]|nr:oxygen-dependent coproporphyrinogen oxidase [Steroidobacteraceae bacterium]